VRILRTFPPPDRRGLRFEPPGFRLLKPF
jgi:hypothetical protein